MTNETFRNKVIRYYEFPFSSSFGMISIAGSLKIFLFAILRSNVKSKDGNKRRFETMANKRVTETNPPSAIVPPKLDTVNTKKPKNNTIEV